MSLTAESLHFAYPSRGRQVLALDDVSVDVPPGERVALLGPNGSGKSTLLRNLSGSLTPQRGRVLLLGQDLHRMDPRERARRLAFVPQDVRISFQFTVREVVMMGRFPYQGRLGIERSGDLDTVERSMDMVRVSHLADRSMDQLSGGEAQRVILAQALAQEPEFLLLDEPTSHLDIKFQCEVMDLLLALNRSRGLTVLASLHDLNLAALYCNRVYLIKGGRVAAQGSPAEALTEKTVAEVFGARVHVGAHPAGGAPLLTLMPQPLTDGETV